MNLWLIFVTNVDKIVQKSEVSCILWIGPLMAGDQDGKMQTEQSSGN